MKLFFQGSLGHRRLLKESDDKRILNKAIYDFCQERDFHIYYSRQWMEDDELKIDVGSHSEFFIITGTPNELKEAVTQ